VNKDFLGQELHVGDWVVRGGRGNKAAEYGMVLARITHVDESSLRGARLEVRYDHSKGHKAHVRVRTLVITNPNTVCRIADPGDAAKALFEKAVDDPESLSEQEIDVAEKWLHGASHQRPWG
jgi:hypothetical protein